MDFPIKNGDFHSYVSLPEGRGILPCRSRPLFPGASAAPAIPKILTAQRFFPPLAGAAGSLDFRDHRKRLRGCL